MHEVLFSIALQHSENSEISASATGHLKRTLSEIIRNHVNTADDNKKQKEDLQNTSPEILQLILTYIPEEAKDSKLSLDTKEKLFNCLRRDFPRELVPVVLRPLLYPGDGEVSEDSTDSIMATNQMVQALAYFNQAFTLLIFIYTNSIACNDSLTF